MKHTLSYLNDFASAIKQTFKYRLHSLLAIGISSLATAAAGQSFGPLSTYSTGVSSSPSGVALGDVNGDGLPDIVSSNSSSNNASVLLGQAGGSFGSAIPHSIGAGGTGVASGDINGDGRLDFVFGSGSTVRILVAQAGGGFAPFSTYTIGDNTGSIGAAATVVDIAIGDLNGDGRADIVSANGPASTVGVLLGVATGGFAPFTAYSTGMGSTAVGVALGDVNGDGRLDIITSNINYDGVGVFLGQAGGGFAPVSAYSTGTSSGPIDVAVGDVNGDGRLDIVTANNRSSTVGVLLGQPNGSFLPVATYSTGIGSFPDGVALGDVNGDGRLDIVSNTHSSTTGSGAIGVLLGQASGFASVITYSTGNGSYPYSVVLGDVNQDGRLDIISALKSTDNVAVLLNTGTFVLATSPHQLVASDVVLYPNPTRNSFTVLFSTSSSPIQAELLNALGQVVRRQVAVAGASIPVETSGLAPGVYTLRLHPGGATLTKRVVIE